MTVLDPWLWQRRAFLGYEMVYFAASCTPKGSKLLIVLNREKGTFYFFNVAKGVETTSDNLSGVTIAPADLAEAF